MTKNSVSLGLRKRPFSFFRRTLGRLRPLTDLRVVPDFATPQVAAPLVKRCSTVMVCPLRQRDTRPIPYINAIGTPTAMRIARGKGQLDRLIEFILLLVSINFLPPRLAMAPAVRIAFLIERADRSWRPG